MRPPGHILRRKGQRETRVFLGTRKINSSSSSRLLGAGSCCLFPTYGSIWRLGPPVSPKALNHTVGVGTEVQWDFFTHFTTSKSVIEVIEIPGTQGTNPIVVCSHVRAVRTLHPHGYGPPAKFATSDVGLSVIRRAITHISLITP